MAGERVATEQENRRLRFGIAIAALALMALFPNERREYA
jgi:hypothetical protein